MKKIRGIKFLPEDATATYDEMNSPVGKLTIITTAKGLHAVLWESDRKNSKCEKVINLLHQSKNEPTIVRTKRQLGEYFERKRKIFDLPLVIDGTAFQFKLGGNCLKYRMQQLCLMLSRQKKLVIKIKRAPLD